MYNYECVGVIPPRISPAIVEPKFSAKESCKGLLFGTESQTLNRCRFLLQSGWSSKAVLRWSKVQLFSIRISPFCMVKLFCNSVLSQTKSRKSSASRCMEARYPKMMIRTSQSAIRSHLHPYIVGQDSQRRKPDCDNIDHDEDYDIRHGYISFQ